MKTNKTEHELLLEILERLIRLESRLCRFIIEQGGDPHVHS